MPSSIDIALSGLNAATTRVAVSANNIANQSSTSSTDASGKTTNTPYTPQRVDQVSLSTGGVQAKVSDVTPATTTVPKDNGTAQVPNVDPVDQLVQLNTASYDFKANLKVIQAQDDIFKSFLNIIS